LDVAQDTSTTGLIEAARTDKTAFSALFRRHYDEIFRYCARRLPERCHAEDVTSQVFLKMVKNFKNFRGDETGFRCWLFRIACNEVNSFYRKSVRHAKALDAIRQDAPNSSTDPEIDDENARRVTFLKEAIATLKPEHQDIITLRYFEGLNSEQIGDTLDMNPATVRSRLSRSLKQLQKYFRIHQQANAEEIFDDDE
jgi:RNA polymerase sigma-70 factor (ECF subfamily)